MDKKQFERALFWVIRAGSYILPFVLLIIINGLFFPFITGKNFLFRIIVEIMTAAWVGLLIINFSNKGESLPVRQAGASGGKKYWPRWNLVNIALVIFIGAIFLSAFFGVDMRNSFWSNFERMDGLVTFFHFLALFFVLTGTFHTRKEWFILLGISIGAGVLVAFYGLLQYKGIVGGLTAGGGERIISTLGNPLYVAIYLTFNIFFALFLWLSTESRALKWLLGGAFLFELIVFFLAGARGAFIGILVGAAVIFFLWLLNTKNTKNKMILLSIITILALAPFFLTVFRDVSFVKNNGVISRFFGISLSGATVQSRFTIWGMAYDSFKERPVFGWGFGNFIIPYAKNYNPKMYGSEAWFDRVHNMPVEILVSGGVVGILTYLMLFLSIFWALVRGVRNNLIKKNAAFIFVGIVAAYLVQISFVFDSISTYLMLFFILGFLRRIAVVNFSISSLSNSIRLLYFPFSGVNPASLNNSRTPLKFPVTSGI